MKIKLKEIVDFINQELDLDIRKKTRKTRYIYARALYYKLSKEHTNQSLSGIGELVGVDHATVLHSLKNTWHIALGFGEHIQDCYNKFNEFVFLVKVKLAKEDADKAVLSAWDLEDENFVESEEIVLLKKEISKLRNEIVFIKNNGDRISNIIKSLGDDERKVEDFFLRAEATANMISKAVYQ